MLSFIQDQKQSLGHDQMISGHSPVSNNATPSTYPTKRKLRDLSPTKTDPVGIAWTRQKEGILSLDSTSETGSSATEKHRGMVNRDQSRVPRQLDYVAVIDGSGKEPFRQSRTEIVDSGSSESSRCASGINNSKTTSEKQISNKTARSPRDYEPHKSSCHQNSSGTDSLASTEASRVPVKLTPCPSGLEAKRATSADFQTTSQRRTTDDVLGTHSTKRTSFSEPIPVHWKTMKHPSYSDNNPTQERVQINNDPVEKMRFQKHVQRSRSSDSGGHQGDQGHQQHESSSAHPHPQELCDKVTEVYTSKFSGRRDSHTSTPIPTPSPHERQVLNLDSVESQKFITAHKDEFQKGGIVRPEFEMKRPLGDEALYKLTCRSPKDEARPCTLDNEPHTPVQRTANEEEKGEEKELPTHTEPKTISNPASSAEGVKRKSSTSEQPKPTASVGNQKCDLRQWLTDKICMDLGFCDHPKPFEQIDDQQQTEAMPHDAAAERKRGDEGFRKSPSTPSDDSEVLQRATREQLGGGNISITQYLVELQAQCKQSGSSSSSSKTSASELVELVKQTDVVVVVGGGGGASSEESSSNPTKRASSVQNIREVVWNPLQFLKDALDETESRQDQGQTETGTGDDEDSAGGASRVQSEQGSYSPGENNNVEWIDDFPTSANANYLDNSDAFNSDTFNSDVPKSDLCPSSGSRSSK